MKYCLFDGSDVVGPFLVEELLARKGFDSHSLVCPEEHSEEENYWKEASLYPEFGFEDSVKKAEEPQPPAQAEPLPENQSDKTEDKISTLLMRASKEMQPFAAQPSAPQTATTPENTPASAAEAGVQLVSGAPNPIEEYFNSIRTGDLGNILGIPDPKANSDANLAKVLEKQFEKTDPVIALADKEPEEDPFDSFIRTSDKKPTPSENASLDEKDLATRHNLEQDRQTAHTQELDVDAVLREANSPFATDPSVLKKEADSAQPAEPITQDLVVPLQEDDPADKTVETILEGTLEVKGAGADVQEPIKRVAALTKPPELDEDKVIKHEVPPQQRRSLKWAWMIVGFLLLVGGILLNIYWKEPEDVPNVPEETAAAEQPVAAESVGLQLLPEETPAQKPVVAVPVAPKTPEEQAKEIVQNYVLDKGRGTIAQYLARHHAQQLASGYTQAWFAEPLHRNVYVVKYRLSKTRQEPIMYIFQVDTSKNKLTGALNNITLDLVGKIK